MRHAGNGARNRPGEAYLQLERLALAKGGEEAVEAVPLGPAWSNASKQVEVVFAQPGQQGSTNLLDSDD